jgi:hypothetical protein
VRFQAVGQTFQADTKRPARLESLTYKGGATGYYVEQSHHSALGIARGRASGSCSPCRVCILPKSRGRGCNSSFRRQFFASGRLPASLARGPRPGLASVFRTGAVLGLELNCRVSGAELGSASSLTLRVSVRAVSHFSECGAADASPRRPSDGIFRETQCSAPRLVISFEQSMPMIFQSGIASRKTLSAILSESGFVSGY